MARKLTKEEINKRLLDREITLTSEYVGALIKSEFKCRENHTWTTTPGNVLFGTPCPQCVGPGRGAPLSKDIVNERLVARGITVMGEFKGVDYKTEFKCRENHIWVALPRNVLSVSSCPSCAKHGFNPEKKAWTYVLNFGSYIKYGITNNLDQRLNTLQKNGNYTLISSKCFENGLLALIWENNIKTIFGGKFVSKEVCPDGYTETLCISRIDELLETMG
jgi:hypothetical protein